MSIPSKALQRAIVGMKLDPSDCIYRSIARAARAVTTAYDQALAPHDLNAGQFTILLTLQRSGPLTVGDLARELAMHGSTVPRVLRALQTRGLLQLAPGKDRRQKLISITESGQRALMPALLSWQRAQRQLLASSAVGNWNKVRRALAGLRTASLAKVAA